MAKLKKRGLNSNYPNTSLTHLVPCKFLCETSHELSAQTLRMLHLIDSVILPSPAFIAELVALSDQFTGAGYIQTLHLIASAPFIETDDSAQKAQMLEEMAKTPQHVAAAAFRSHLLNYDVSAAVQACRVPASYIAVANHMADLDQFKRLCPQLVTAQTVIFGHFSPLEIPGQINAMLGCSIAHIFDER